MKQLSLTQDIQPLSKFRSHAAAFVDRVQQTKNPMVITRHGQSAAVLLDVNAYEDMRYEIDLIREIRMAEAELDAGQGVPHEEVFKQLLKKK